MAAPESWENVSPNFGIRYPKTNAPAKYLPDAFQHIGADLDDALTRSSLPNPIDSGWVGVPLRSGFAPQGANGPMVRKIGKVVYLRWGIASTGIATASTAYTVADVPAGYRPVAGSEYFMCVGGSVGSTAGGGRWEVATDGTMKLTSPSTLGNYYLAPAGTCWLLA